MIKQWWNQATASTYLGGSASLLRDKQRSGPGAKDSPTNNTNKQGVPIYADAPPAGGAPFATGSLGGTAEGIGEECRAGCEAKGNELAVGNGVRT